MTKKRAIGDMLVEAHRRISAEPALTFDLVLEAAIPVAVPVNFVCVVSEMQSGKPGVSGEADASGFFVNLAVDPRVLVNPAVKIAKGDERANLKRDIRGRIVAIAHVVMNDRAVLAVDHEDRLLNLDAFDFVSENREWIQPKSLQIPIALRVNNAGILFG